MRVSTSATKLTRYVKVKCLCPSVRARDLKVWQIEESSLRHGVYILLRDYTSAKSHNPSYDITSSHHLRFFTDLVQCTEHPSRIQ